MTRNPFRLAVALSQFVVIALFVGACLGFGWLPWPQAIAAGALAFYAWQVACATAILVWIRATTPRIEVPDIGPDDDEVD